MNLTIIKKKERRMGHGLETNREEHDGPIKHLGHRQVFNWRGPFIKRKTKLALCPRRSGGVAVWHAAYTLHCTSCDRHRSCAHNLPFDVYPQGSPRRPITTTASLLKENSNGIVIGNG